MKTLGIIAGLFLNATLHAAGGDFVIEKHYGGGFVAPTWRQFEGCAITSTEVVNTYKADFYGVVLETTTTINLSSGVVDLIKAASLETWQTKGGPCDAPVTTIIATYTENGQSVDVPLELNSTCTSQDGFRDGPASTHLMKIIEKLCN